MIYLGVDIAKNTHVAAAMTAGGEVLLSSFSFNNDIVDFSLLEKRIAAFPKEELLIGMESTAHYNEKLIFFLFNKGYRIAIINPLQTASL